MAPETYVHRLHLADCDLDLLADDLGDTEDVGDEDVVVREPVIYRHLRQAALFSGRRGRETERGHEVA